jgi:ABC-type antimicrobial peptide transport system permease subunit
MFRLVWSQVMRRRGRSLAVVAAIVVAAVSFSLLTSAVATSRLQVQGRVEANFRSAYDILVRPNHSITPLERSDKLVQENYLAGIFGGITMKQYEEIRHLPGVQVAAPIAMVGYVLPTYDAHFAITNLIDRTKSQQLLKVAFRWTSDRGLSHYSEATRYFYVTRQRFGNSQGYQSQADPVTGKTLHVCPTFAQNSPPTTSAFSNVAQLVCWSTSTPQPGQARSYGLKPGQIGTNFFYPVPLMVAAIDPRAEAQLVGLQGAITSGRYLKENEPVRSLRANPAKKYSMRYRSIPMLMSSRLSTDEDLKLVVSRVDTGDQKRVPGRLSGTDAVHWLTTRRAKVVRVTHLPGRAIYPRILKQYSAKRITPFSMPYWSAGQAKYLRKHNGHLQPKVQYNGPDTWANSLLGFYAPAESSDVGFRKLTAHAASNLIVGNTFGSPIFRTVGQFDPHRLLGFSRLSQVPLTTYYPPSAEPADSRTSRLLHGRPLLPNNNLAGYLQQPPLLLTNLRSLPAFYNSSSYTNTEVGRAPISVIRVRVAGVTGVDRDSRERVRLVAEQIQRLTGLDVDITIGSSPTPELIDLPAGKHGRPALTLKEGWVKKGVAVQLLSAIDKKSLSLFALVLLVCSLFLLNAVTAAVRSRAAELGILSCLGWPRRKIFWLLEFELLVTGLVAGLAGTAIAAGLAAVLDLRVAWWQLALITPVAVVLAGVAGLPPTRRAARATPMQAVQPTVRAPRHARQVTSITRLGLVGVGRTPGRSMLAGASLFIGVAALAGLLAIQQQFAHNAVGTLLGNVVAIQVRGVDLFAVILVLALGGFTIADVAYLNISERHAEIGTLRATGWTERHVQRLFATEALTIAAIGAAAGAVLGVGVTAALLRPDVLILIRAAAIAAAGGILAALMALTVPLARLGRLAPAGMLEE